MNDTSFTRGTVDATGKRYEWYTSRDFLLKRRICNSSKGEKIEAEPDDYDGNIHKRRRLRSSVTGDAHDEGGCSNRSEPQGTVPHQIAVKDVGLVQSDQDLWRPSQLDRISSEQGEAGEDSSSDAEATGASLSTRNQREQRTLSHVKVEGPAFARSAYHLWHPGVPIKDEFRAIQILLHQHRAQCRESNERPDYTFFQLDDFSIYRPQEGPYANEMCALHLLKGVRRENELRFDGTLSIGGTQFSLVNTPFEVLTLDSYLDKEVVNMGDKICIQSRNAAHAHVWYRLGRPSEDYRRFYTPFLWLAHFTKFFVDFLSHNENTCLGDFRTHFSSWLGFEHGGNDHVLDWFQQAGHTDFRTTVAANYDFLFKECWSLDHDRSHHGRLLDHQIWCEIDASINCLGAIPRQPIVEKLTLVSPYVHHCFRDMYFASLLKLAKPREEVADLLEDRKQSLGLTPYYSGVELLKQHSNSETHLRPTAVTPESIQRGDVVVIEADIKSRWQTSQHAKYWFAYVQGVRTVRGDKQVMDLIWLYQPEDTTLGTAFYPFKNELFFSDHCECGRDAFETAQAVGKVNVQFFVGDPGSIHGYFVRHKYCTVAEEGTYDFITLSADDFTCVCMRPEQDNFQLCVDTYDVGSTVLVYSKKIASNLLEPAYITSFNYEQRTVVVRVFKRSTQAGAAANLLRPTQFTIKLRAEHIIRKCQVKVFRPHELQRGNAPGLYGRGGAGDFFYLITSDGQQPQAEHIDLPPFIEGWNLGDPNDNSAQKLTGMGMFCGGGNFDRGLEEGGAVHFRYAIDLAERALHSYRANLEDPDSVQLFLGSVNDYLAKAMDGTPHQLIASIGEIQVIAAGSPCPGFSRLQHDKSRPNALRDASLVTSVVSYVDIYSPLYLVFENVLTMSNSMGPQKDQNVFRQVLAALVGLGYQIQQFTMYAPDYGSPQQRPRLFIVATAPGMTPWQRPSHTHASERKTPRMNLGRLSNGLNFGERDQCDEVGVFPYVSMEEATKDLPSIGDGQVQLCPAYPDHRTPNRLRAAQRLRMAAVPVRPRGMTFMKAFHTSLIQGEAHRAYVDSLRSSLRRGPQSNAYKRLVPDGFCPTMVKSIALEDGISGGCVHWDQHRIITVMESKRAQGYLDTDVIIGTPWQQQQIIGNSVDRKVALALGLVLREAWKTNIARQGGPEAVTTGLDYATTSALAVSVSPTPLIPEQCDETSTFGFKAFVSTVTDRIDTGETQPRPSSSHTPDLTLGSIENESEEDSSEASLSANQATAIVGQDVEGGWANQITLRAGGTLFDHSTDVARDHAESAAADCSVRG